MVICFREVNESFDILLKQIYCEKIGIPLYLSDLRGEFLELLNSIAVGGAVPGGASREDSPAAWIHLPCVPRARRCGRGQRDGGDGCLRRGQAE